MKKSIDVVLRTQTRGGRMVGADESTELWRHPITDILLQMSYKNAHPIVTYFNHLLLSYS